MGSRNEDTQLFQMLIKMSAKFNIDLNSKNEQGWTVFHLACSEGRKNIVEMMVKNSADFDIDITAENQDGKNGLMIAEDYRMIEVAELLRWELPGFSNPNKRPR